MARRVATVGFIFGAAAAKGNVAPHNFSAVAPSHLLDAEVVEPSMLDRMAHTEADQQLPFGHPSLSVKYPTYEGFTLWLVEEFEDPLDLNSDPIWTWSDGGLGESSIRFTRENLVFEDGKLKITVLDNGPVAQPQPQWCSLAETQGMAPKKLTSGELRTKHNMFRYGIYEARMKAPSIQPGDAHTNGNYISTMFVYRDAKYKHWREIDVEVTGDSKNSLTMNVLYAENAEAWSPAIQESLKFEAGSDVNLREEFHTYAFAWLPTGISWYFDGKLIGTHGPEAKLPVPNLSTKIMMNLWIFSEGFGFGGPEGWNNRYPMHSEYDWFRFYKWDGDTRYPCPDATDSCLTEDDKYLSANNPCDGIPNVGLRNGAPSCIAECPYGGVFPMANSTFYP